MATNKQPQQDDDIDDHHGIVISTSSSSSSITTSTTEQPTGTSTFVKFVLTGFGPFGGVPDNPTSIIVNGMKDYLLSSSSSSKDDDVVVSSSTTKRRKIEASGSSNSNSNSNYKSKNDDDTTDRDNDNWKSNLISHIQDCIILETSAYAVQEVFMSSSSDGSDGVSSVDTVGRIHQHVQQNQMDNKNKNKNNKDIITVLLHLGVNYKGKQIQLEQCSYNDATFRIPDQRGYQPQNETISTTKNENTTNNDTYNTNSNNNNINNNASEKLGACCKTTINVHQLCTDINNVMKQSTAMTTTTSSSLLRGGGGGGSGGRSVVDDDGNHTIMTVSTDPGRFVCNYIYYTSLAKYKQQRRRHDDGGTNNNNTTTSSSSSTQNTVHSLFVHVPPFDTVPKEYYCKESQFNYIAMIMDKLKSGNYF